MKSAQGSDPTAGMMVTPNVRLVRAIGEGGMGSVWVAEHLSLRTNVVVKFMARDLADSQEALARFSREAAAASQVKSPHVVQTLDHGVTPDGLAYIVMELLEGHDLEQHLRARGKLPPGEVAEIVAQLARALTKAHERGIVHRDIKPSNVFLCDAGGGELFVKLLDFGIAKGATTDLQGSTTRTGSFVGSPYYMSPEQVVGAKNVDAKTDLWALGVVAFEAMTGDKPFWAETVGALALKIHRDPLPLPSEANAALPKALDAWFARACAREAGDRFASAKEMAEALAAAATGQSPSSLRIDSAKTPRRPLALAETELDASTMRSRADARSETGAGVGLASASVHLPGVGRGKWIVAGVVGVVAIGVGFAVPRIVGRGERGETGAASAIAEPLGVSVTLPATTTPTATSAATPTPAAASTQVPTPTSSTRARGRTSTNTGTTTNTGTNTATSATATTSAVSAKPKPTSDEDGIK